MAGCHSRMSGAMLRSRGRRRTRLPRSSSRRLKASHKDKTRHETNTNAIIIANTNTGRLPVPRRVQHRGLIDCARDRGGRVPPCGTGDRRRLYKGLLGAGLSCCDLSCCCCHDAVHVADPRPLAHCSQDCQGARQARRYRAATEARCPQAQQQRQPPPPPPPPPPPSPPPPRAGPCRTCCAKCSTSARRSYRWPKHSDTRVTSSTSAEGTTSPSPSKVRSTAHDVRACYSHLLFTPVHTRCTNQVRSSSRRSHTSTPRAIPPPR